MGQRGKFIRDPTRTEEKKIQKWWKIFYIIDGQSTKRYEWHSDQLQQQQKNKEQNRGCSTLIFRLLCNLSKCKTTILYHKHDTYNPQRRILLIRTQGLQKSRREIIHGVPKLHKHQRKKLCCTHSMKNNKKCDGILRRSRSWIYFSQ